MCGVRGLGEGPAVGPRGGGLLHSLSGASARLALPYRAGPPRTPSSGQSDIIAIIAVALTLIVVTLDLQYATVAVSAPTIIQ